MSTRFVLRRIAGVLPLVLSCAVALPPAFAADKLVTKPEAETMVIKAVAAIKTGGKEKTFEQINRKDGPFTDRDLYITVYGLDGVVRAHGANLKMIDKNMIDVTDPDGKAFVKERVELARKKPAFWQEYKFTNPVSKKTEPKAMYCQAHEDMVVCGGVYLRGVSAG